MYLGCEENFRYIAESANGHHGLVLWPPPLVAPAHFYSDGDSGLKLKGHIWLREAKCLFREDSFDPGMRIRRGRFYRRDTKGQPQRWSLLPHPSVPMNHLPVNGPYYYLDMDVFRHERWKDIVDNPSRIPLVLLGTGDAHSLWRVVDSERNAFGDDVTTLKSISYLGVLPRVNIAAIPTVGSEKAKECIDKVVDTAYTAGPESVIDRCRDAASALLAAYLSTEDIVHLKKDLGSLVKILDAKPITEKKTIVINSARTIARYHARAKPNSKANHQTPPVYEADAELCLHCLSAIIRELGYASEHV